MAAGSGQARHTADGVPLASWWWRALAAVVDNVLSSTVALVIAFPVWRTMYLAVAAYVEAVVAAQQSGAGAPSLSPTSLISSRDQLILTAVSLGVGMAYHVFFLRWKAATPGKLLLGLRVVPVDRGRSTDLLEWRSVGLRAAIWVMPGINTLFAVVSLADALFPLWHSKRQALHDLAARTQVIRPQPGQSTARTTP